MLSFAVNTDIVTEPPADWADLLKPEFANSVALAGDPRASNQAILGVYAAGLAAGGAAGGDAGKKGLDYFAELNKAGNFVPVIGKSGTLAQGATPIVVWWDYNALSGRDALNGNPPVEVVVPKSGVVAGVYVQAISRLRAAPERRQALDGVPLLRRGPAQVARGLLPPDPLRRAGRRAAWCRRSCSTSCRRPRPTRRRSSRRSRSRRRWPR